MPENGPMEIKLHSDQVSAKLLNLKDYMPNAAEPIFDFATYLSTVLHDDTRMIGASEFALVAYLSITDLQIGINQTTKEPIRNNLVGMPELLYRLLGKHVPLMSDALFTSTNDVPSSSDSII